MRGPQPARARARFVPQPPREEVGRFTVAAAAEEERPTTATGASLPRLVVAGGHGRGARAGTGAQARGTGARAPSPPGRLSLRPGVGAPRASGPGEGHLGRAAPDYVCGDPRVAADLAGGGAALDRAGPGR